MSVHDWAQYKRDLEALVAALNERSAAQRAKVEEILMEPVINPIGNGWSWTAAPTGAANWGGVSYTFTTTSGPTHEMYPAGHLEKVRRLEEIYKPFLEYCVDFLDQDFDRTELDKLRAELGL